MLKVVVVILTYHKFFCVSNMLICIGYCTQIVEAVTCYNLITFLKCKIHVV
jgi:trehalose-6-phosphate synthase